MAQENNQATQALANIYRTPELWAKITFTFLCLVIYRVGAHITAPGIDVQALTDYFTRQNNGLLNLYDMFVGGGLSRATPFGTAQREFPKGITAILILGNYFRIEQMDAVLAGWSIKLLRALQRR